MSTQNETPVPKKSSWYHPSQLEMLVDIVNGGECPDFKGTTREYTINVPLQVVLLLDAMLAHTSGVSRNEFICQLLDLALQEVREKLPEEMKEKILWYVSVQMDSSNDKLLKFK